MAEDPVCLQSVLARLMSMPDDTLRTESQLKADAQILRAAGYEIILSKAERARAFGDERLDQVHAATRENDRLITILTRFLNGDRLGRLGEKEARQIIRICRSVDRFAKAVLGADKQTAIDNIPIEAKS